jgi:predicted kinase
MATKTKVEKLVPFSYCRSRFKDTAKLSEHVNSVHNNITGLRLDNHIKQGQSMAKSAENSLDISQNLSETLNELLRFTLIDALTGRRSRRFCLGAEIPDGVLSFKSKHKPSR